MTASEFWAAHSLVATESWFEPHTHAEDHLAWVRRGTGEITVAGVRWDLHAGAMVWVPAGVVHDVALRAGADLLSLYANVGLRPAGPSWVRARVLHADRLLSAVVEHLADDSPAAGRRHLCWTLYSDLMADATDLFDSLTLPTDPPARLVAEQVLRSPGDPRGIEAWASGAGVSSRTLMRAFLRDTGCTFGRWRTLARLNAGAALIVAGEPVHVAAEAVGYRTSSGFIASFRAEFGTTPEKYRRQLR
nr:AraC family transcriptional regulator [Aeromicrobium sp. CFBP 8757]